MRALLDGSLSLIAALCTLALIGPTVWFSWVALDAGLAPAWGYIPVAGLGGVGLVLTMAFVRKGLRGIAPSRTYRR